MFRRGAPRLNYSPPRLSIADCGSRVVTFCESSPVSAFAVATQLGPRFEDAATRGCSRILEKLAFGVKQDEGGKKGMESYHVAPSLGVVNQKEVMLYTMAALRWEAESAFDLLASMAVDPSITEESLLQAKSLSQLSLPSLRQEPSKVLFELLHQASWGGNTLGLPAFDLDALAAAPEDPLHEPDVSSMAHVTPEVLTGFVEKLVQPERVTVVARGVEHEAMLEIVNKRLGGVYARRPRVELEEELKGPSVFTGGVKRFENLSAPDSILKFEEKNHTHIGVMFRGLPLGDPREPVQLVIQAILGGGMSFAAGGPGRGQLTKLYRESLTSNAWLESIEGLSAAYSDSGSLGIYGEAAHDRNAEMFALIAKQMREIPDRITAPYVTMGTNRCLSQHRMAFEERLMSIEDVARFVAVRGRLPDRDGVRRAIEAVTLEQIQEYVAERVADPPAIGVYGNVSGLPSDDEMMSALKA